ncbi:hypothetical protein [Chitiniphilus eburneus]|uniref:hypothetical protein n=1 Tax=Chitiniphilus eburneus TaxID=2571148 RepID=UPI0035CE9231
MIINFTIGDEDEFLQNASVADLEDIEIYGMFEVSGEGDSYGMTLDKDGGYVPNWYVLSDLALFFLKSCHELSKGNRVAFCDPGHPNLYLLMNPVGGGISIGVGLPIQNNFLFSSSLNLQWEELSHISTVGCKAYKDMVVEFAEKLLCALVEINPILKNSTLFNRIEEMKTVLILENGAS